jgi:hypothetical protein
VTEGVVDTSGDTSGQLIDKVDLKLDNTRGDFEQTGRFFVGGFVNNSKIKIEAAYADVSIDQFGRISVIAPLHTPYIFNGIIKSDSSTWNISERTFVAGLLQASNIVASEIINPGYVSNGISLKQLAYNILRQSTIARVFNVSPSNINLGFDIAGCVDNSAELVGQKVFDIINAIGILSGSKWYIDSSNNFIFEPIVQSGTSSWDITLDDIVSIDDIGFDPLQFNSVTWDSGEGNTGSAGIPGDPGAPGIPGTPGADGINGKDGFSIIGQDGDDGQDSDLIIPNITLTTANVADSTDRRYCTDAQKVVIGNTSGTNTGDSSTPAETTTSIGALINGATDKSTPVDADYVGLMDSADSNILKKLSWANIKAKLKTYFDNFYAVLGASPAYFTPASPKNLTSNSFLMFGLGGTFAITPTKSGKVRFTVKYAPGGVGTTALNSFKIAYGTGAAPANGAAATGTVVGGTDQGGAVVSVNGTPSLVNRNVIVTGLTLNTAYWFDVQGAKNASHTSVGMSEIEATLEELPY